MSKNRGTPGGQNLNSDLLCGISIDTTGNEPYTHELCEIAVVPFDASFNLATGMGLFHQVLKPNKDFVIDDRNILKRLPKLKLEGLDRFEGAEVFVRWFEGLSLNMGKRIVPMSYEYSRVEPFLRDWLGNKTYNMIFSSAVRDIKTVADFLNDKASFKAEGRFPFMNMSLAGLCNTLCIQKFDTSVLPSALLYGKVYGAMMR